MQVNQAALSGIQTGFQQIFNDAFAKATPLWEKIATKVNSQTSQENYKWLGSIPKMREWIGQRQINNLTASDYTIKNRDFELTVSVDRNDIEDDTLGIYHPIVSETGRSAAMYPDDLVFELLTGGFKNKCYDGQPFFSKNHPNGKKQKESNMTNDKLTAESYAKARAEMMSRTDENNKGLGVVPNLLVVSPKNEATALKILKAEQIEGSTNVYKDTAELLVVPAIAGEGDDMWFLLDTTRAVKPLIFQERKAADFQSFTKPDDANVFLNKEFIYGVDARGNAGYAFWQMAYASDGTA